MSVLTSIALYWALFMAIGDLPVRQQITAITVVIVIDIVSYIMGARAGAKVPKL